MSKPCAQSFNLSCKSEITALKPHTKRSKKIKPQTNQFTLTPTPLMSKQLNYNIAWPLLKAINIF